MKPNLLQKFIILIKRPAVQLTIVLIAGVIVNATLFSLKVQPNFVEKTLLNQTIRQLENQRAVLNNTPLPEKIDQNKVEELIKQVPTKFEMSRVLLDFKRIEGESGAQIIDLTVGERDVEVKDELADYIENALKKAPSAPAVQDISSMDAGVNNGEIQPAPHPFTPKLSTPIKPEIVSLSVHGSYSEVISFMGLLYTMERIVNIREWSLEPIEQEEYAIQFSLTLYTAPKYAGTFHDMSAIHTPVPEKREEPVVPDKEFKQMLYP